VEGLIWISGANPTFLGAIPFSKIIWAVLVLDNVAFIINMQAMQMMKYIVCHTNSSPQVELLQNSQSTTSSRKGHVQYNPNHRYTSMKKHLLNEHHNDFAKYIFESKLLKVGLARVGKKSNKQQKVQPLTNHTIFLKSWELQTNEPLLTII
jgi:hypothetical protein